MKWGRDRLGWLSVALFATSCAMAEGNDPGLNRRSDGGPDAGSAGDNSGGSGGSGATGGSGTGGSGTGGSGATNSGGSGGVCVPGTQVACACPGGAQGAQACNGDGTGYDPCECPTGTGGTGTGGTGTGGTGTGGTGTGGTGTGGTATGGTGGSATGGTGGSSTGGAGGAGGGASGDPDDCPGAELVLGGAVTVVNDTLTGQTNDFSAFECAPGGDGNDVVYHVTPGSSGTLSVTVTPSGFSAYVSYSQGTCTPGSPVKCQTGISVGNPVTLSFAVTAGTSYYLFVDSYNTTSTGPFTMEVTLN